MFFLPCLHFPAGAFLWGEISVFYKIVILKLYKIDKNYIKSIKFVKKMIKSLQILIFNTFLTPIYDSYSKTICFSFRESFFSLIRENFHIKDMIHIPP